MQQTDRQTDRQTYYRSTKKHKSKPNRLTENIANKKYFLWNAGICPSFKSRSSDLGHAPFWGYSSSTVYYSSNGSNRENTKSLAKNRNPRWRPSAILDFRKSDFWALGPHGLPIFYHGVKFGAKMLIDAEIMVQNRNPRWRPSAILHFWKSDFEYWDPLGCRFSILV